jgi:hypothetical protein
VNLYRVISEELSEVIPILDDGTGPTELYAIAELVAAKSRGQAKWMAYKSDWKHFEDNIREMPKFLVICVVKDVELEPGFYSDDPRFQRHWIN